VIPYYEPMHCVTFYPPIKLRVHLRERCRLLSLALDLTARALPGAARFVNTVVPIPLPLSPLDSLDIKQRKGGK
jgi:hypothetical protein